MPIELNKYSTGVPLRIRPPEDGDRFSMFMSCFVRGAIDSYSSYQNLATVRNRSGESTNWFGIVGEDNQVRGSTRDGSNTQNTGAATINNSAWYHIFFATNGANSWERLYKDGVAASGANPRSNFHGIQRLILGAGDGALWWLDNVKIAELFIGLRSSGYDGVEPTAFNYIAGGGDPFDLCDGGTCLAYYPFDGDCYDYSDLYRPDNRGWSSNAFNRTRFPLDKARGEYPQFDGPHRARRRFFFLPHFAGAESGTASVSASGAFTGPAASFASVADVDVSASSALSAPIGSGAASIEVLAALSAALGAPIGSISIATDADVDASGAIVAPGPSSGATLDADVDASGALVAPSPVAAVTIDTGGGIREITAALVAPSATISATSTVLAQVSGIYGAPSATVVATISGGLKGLALIATRVFQHFNDNFPALQPTVKIAWDGVPFDPETDVPTGASWVRISVLPGDRRRITVGQTARRRRIGLISVQTFAPAGDGLLDASDVSDDVEAVFDRATITGLRLGAPRTERVGQVGAWYQLNTFVPFQRDDDD